MFAHRGLSISHLRNALSFAFGAAIYALLAGSLVFGVRPATPAALARAFMTGYGLAVLIFAAAHLLAWAALGLLGPRRREAFLPLAAPLASLIAGAAAVPRLFQAADRAALIQVAAFVGAALALSTAHDFPALLQRQLVPARRVRDLLARRPQVGRRVIQSIGPILRVSPLVPWLFGGAVWLAFPSALRGVVGARVLVLTYLLHHLNRGLLEELAVWAFLHALRAGDFLWAARLPIRPPRLAAEIAAAPADLEAPFARFIACGIHGLEGSRLTPAALSRLVRVHLSAYGLAAGRAVGGQRLGSGAPTAGPSLVRRLLERGLRFHLEAAPSTALEPLPLPRWSELIRPEGRARLAALSAGEPLWQAVLRLYELPVRAILLPLSLLWLLLLLLVVFEIGPQALLLAGAVASFGLLLWLTMGYGSWIFNQSLRRRDFEFLARQLGAAKMRGELEDALGARDPRLRERAIELLLFNDSIARLGITVPPAGLRKFLKRAARR